MPELPDPVPLYARHDEADRAWREERRLVDPSITWELIAAEREHFLAQEPVTFSAASRPAPGTIVLDRDGDGWEFGRTRWTQLSGNGAKYLEPPDLCPRESMVPTGSSGDRRPVIVPPNGPTAPYDHDSIAERSEDDDAAE